MWRKSRPFSNHKEAVNWHTRLIAEYSTWRIPAMWTFRQSTILSQESMFTQLSCFTNLFCAPPITDCLHFQPVITSITFSSAVFPPKWWRFHRYASSRATYFEKVFLLWCFPLFEGQLDIDGVTQLESLLPGSCHARLQNLKQKACLVNAYPEYQVTSLVA